MKKFIFLVMLLFGLSTAFADVPGSIVVPDIDSSMVTCDHDPGSGGGAVDTGIMIAMASMPGSPSPGTPCANAWCNKIHNDFISAWTRVTTERLAAIPIA